MKSAVETVNPTRVKLTVEVPFAELKPAMDKAYKTISGQVNIPGFRPGKVPPPIIDQRVGRGVVLQEALNDVIPEYYGKAAGEQEINPVGEPDVEVVEIPEDKDGDLKFTVEVDRRPEITEPVIEGISVDVDSIDVTDEDLNEQLDELRERFGTLVAVDRPIAQDDFVSIDLTAKIGDDVIDEAQGISYQIGTGTMLEGMDDALIDLTAEEETTFTAPLRGGEHAGQDALISLKVNSVKERELPELDDDFAELASEFDTLDALKDSLKEQVRVGKKNGQIAQAQDLLLTELTGREEIPVPQSMIDQEVQIHLEAEGREDDEEHRATIAEQAVPALQRQMVLDALARKYDVQVSQADLINHIVATAPQYNMDPQTFANAIEEANQVPALAAEVARRKALTVALSEITVKDASGAVVDLGLTSDDAEGEATEGAADAAKGDDKADAKADTKDAKADKVEPKADDKADTKAADADKADAKAADADKADAKGAKADDADAKPAKKTTKKAAAKKTTKKAAAKKTATKKAAAKKTTKKAAAKKTTKKAAAKKTTKKAAAKKADTSDD